MGDIKPFTIETDSLINKIIFTLGETSSYANKIKFNVDVMPEFGIKDIKAIPFSANMFHEVLMANKEAEKGTLSFSKEGLIKLFFKEGNIESIYYLVRLEE